MEEAAAEATIAQTAKPPPAEESGPSPPEGRAPTATPAPSSAPTTTPAGRATSVPQTAPPPRAAAKQRPPATPQEPIAQPAATSAPSMTPPPSATSAPSAAAQPAALAPPAEAGHQQSSSVKKRKLETRELQNSTYLKIHAVVRDLRPAFIEVLHAPDFQNCKAADDIRRQMKVLLDLSKLLRTEAVSSGKKTIEGQSLVEDRKEPMENRVKVENQVGPDGALAGVPNQPGKAPSVAEETTSEAKGLEKQLQGHQGTYVVGGSPMGWNFLVYPGSQLVYYGVTKEAARLRRSGT